MEDPFGLLEITNKTPSREEKKKTFSAKAYLTVISILVLFSLALVTLFIFQRKSISADIESPSATIKLSNLPTSIESGQSITFNIVFTGTDDKTENAYALIQGRGVNLNKTADAAKNLAESQDGYIRRMTDTEFAKFDEKGDSGVYFKIGSLSDTPRTLTVKAVISSGNEAETNLESKIFVPKFKVKNCGFLNLMKCSEQDGIQQLASGRFELSPQASGKIKLRSGFNFISLPYVFTPESLAEFFASLKSKWAYVFVPSTGEYLSLLTATNASKIKPGVGFWVYDSNGGQYDLPKSRVETNLNETYTLALDIGWNQVGNPYSKRMILSGKDILVRELSSDGSPSGTAYDLKTAISNGTLSDPYSIVYPTSSSTSADIKTAKIALDNTIEPFSGFLINATKKVNLVIPGKEVIAPGDVISSRERAKIENWISDNGLNQYGDPNGTVYAGGSPLFDESTGQTIDRMDYILLRHPDRPWNR